MYQKCFLFLVFFIGFGHSMFAQDLIEAEKKALLLFAQKDYDKALPMLKSLYETAPYDKKYYDNYYKALIVTERYDTAIALCNYMSKIRREDLSIYVDLGNVYELKGDKKQAKKAFEQAIEQLNGSEYQVTSLVSAFDFIGKKEEQISAYEAYQKKANNPYAFAYELALLYDEKGKTEEALALMLQSLSRQPFGLENAKQALDRMVQNDPKKLKKAQAALAKNIKAEPSNYLWRELYSMLQASNGDISEQLKDIIALDKQQDQHGTMVFNWCKEQYFKDEWEHAIQGLNFLMKMPGDDAIKMNARQLDLIIRKQKLERSFPIPKEQLANLLSDYRKYFELSKQSDVSRLVLDYADVLALYADSPQLAYDTLDAVLAFNRAQADLLGEAKLRMGDYQVLLGNVWDAALLYSQVDKGFKEDRLGEEARFRNAKLSYYRGDFEYAQGQLSVLKASTSELIANDALYLSVLITENTPEDKNFDALKMFSRADLLQFQHKYQEADDLLDSLAKAYPESDLQDDILMQRANIAMKKQDYSKAVEYLQEVQVKYKEDVLADDATMKLADIYEKQFKDIAKAKSEYERLIIDFPGSTFAQQARTRLDALNKPGI